MSELDRPLLREFRQGDLRSVQDLIFATIDACYAPVYPPRALAFFKEFHAEDDILRRQRDGNVLVVEQDGKVIATGAMVEGEIFAVFVHPSFQKQGHGKAVMRALENMAVAEGHRVSELSVSLPSRRFYEDLGYELVETRSRDLGDGQRLEFWKARKNLD